MRRVVIALGVTGALFLAITPAGCASQLMDVMAVLCPDCYANYLKVTGQ